MWSKETPWTLTRTRRGPNGFETTTIEHASQPETADGYKTYVLFPVQDVICQDVLQVGAAEFKTPTPKPEPKFQTRQPIDLIDDASSTVDTEVDHTETMSSVGRDVSQDPQTIHNSLHQNPQQKRSRGGPPASRGPRRGETQHVPPMTNSMGRQDVAPMDEVQSWSDTGGSDVSQDPETMHNSLHQAHQQMRPHGGLDAPQDLLMARRNPHQQPLLPTLTHSPSTKAPSGQPEQLGDDAFTGASGNCQQMPATDGNGQQMPPKDWRQLMQTEMQNEMPATDGGGQQKSTKKDWRQVMREENQWHAI